MERKILFGVFFLGLASFLTPYAYGDQDEALLQKESELKRIEQEFEEYRRRLESEFSEKTEEGRGRVEEIRLRLEDEFLTFDETNQIREEAENRLVEIQEEIGTLEGQLKSLDISLDTTQAELDTIKIQILRRIADLTVLAEETEKLETEKEIQEKAVLGFFALLQKEHENFESDDGVRNFLRVVLSDDSFSTHVLQEQQIRSMDAVGRDLFHKLEDAEEKIAEVSRLIVKENRKLSELHDLKSHEEKRLAEQVAAKRRVMDYSKKSEEEFQKLLQESREQMEDSAYLIAELKGDKRLFEQKIESITDGYNDKKERLEELNIYSDELYGAGEEFLAEDTKEIPFLWPVEPKKGLSAYFKDAGYKKVFSVDHNAIDIPTPQGSEIQSPALGYVYKVSDNGMGYSSIILAHRNNLMTVYGHISDIQVEEGALVKQGDIIGLSGGMPGTKGAGWMTTGPHLHFEVFENGVHKNPLSYLPLDVLPLDSIPSEYLERYLVEKEKLETRN